MDSICHKKQNFVFEFNYVIGEGETTEKAKKSLTETIELPFDTNVTSTEYAYKLAKQHNLPEHLNAKLIEQLDQFVDNNIDVIHLESLDRVRTNKTKLLAKSKHYLEQIEQSNNQCNNSQHDGRAANMNENIVHDFDFYKMYHQIIHSGVMTQQLMQLENHNSDVIRDMLADREEFLNSLLQDQNDKIESILLDGSYSEKEINTITNNNFSLAEKCRKDWNEKIKTIRNDQKREFYSWIKNTYEDLIKGGFKKSLSMYEIESSSPEPKNYPNFVTEPELDEEILEESYTINLGSQLKTTHNLRLISANILQFCNNICTPQRLQTAMSLYSNSLSAVVLLVDKSINTIDGIQAGKHCFRKFG